MNLFHVIDDVFVITRSRRGVYKQAKVYARDGRLYAGVGGGFVQLHKGGTSCPDISWSDLTPHRDIKIPRVGAPEYLWLAPPMQDAKVLEPAE